MDIKEMIASAAEKISKDQSLQQQFKQDPIKAVEKVLGIDLPDDVMEKVVAGIKGKISVDKLGDLAGGLKGLLGK